MLLRSRELAERVRMSWLEKDEQVHFITRKHPIFLLLSFAYRWSASALLVAAAAFFGRDRTGIGSARNHRRFIFALLWLAWNNHNWAMIIHITNQAHGLGGKGLGFSHEPDKEAPLGWWCPLAFRALRMGRFLVTRMCGSATIIGKCALVGWRMLR